MVRREVGIIPTYIYLKPGLFWWWIEWPVKLPTEIAESAALIWRPSINGFDDHHDSRNTSTEWREYTIF